MSVEIRHISNHKRTSSGIPHPTSGYARTTNAKFSQYVIVHGKGSRRKSVTFHGTKEQAERQATLYA